VAILGASAAGADVVIRTGNFDAGVNVFDQFSYGLGVGAYRFSLVFSTPVAFLRPDSTVEKITTTNFYCDFGDGQGEVNCGGDDVPTLPEFDQITSTTYQVSLRVDPPYHEPPPSPPPYMRYDQFDSCCSIQLDFDTREAGSYVLSYVAVPEPAAWSLLIGGLFGVGALLRHRRSVAIDEDIGGRRQ
jgi:hypothetical protein